MTGTSTSLPFTVPGIGSAAGRGPLDLRLSPAARVLWRSSDSVQIELGERAVVIENVTSDDVAALLPVRVMSAAGPGRIDPALDALRLTLYRSGFLVPTSPIEPTNSLDAATTGRSSSSAYGRRLPGHLTAERAALTASRGPEATAILDTRQRAAVAVHGTARLAVALASTLAAAGVGRIELLSTAEVRIGDICPAGLTPADEGRRFRRAAEDAIRRCAPDVDTTALPPGRRIDLVVLTDPGPLDSVIRERLHIDGQPHLAVSVDGQRAVIGPLVRPGVTSCLRCADLHRTERDPDWPTMAVQLAGRPRHRVRADVGMCVATAGLGATQVLAFLDRAEAATESATLEWQLPDWRLRRRSWPVHPDCDCGATAALATARQNGDVIKSVIQCFKV